MSKKKVIKINDDAPNTTTTKPLKAPKIATTKAKAPTKSSNKSAPTRKPLARKVNIKEANNKDEDGEDESDEEEVTDETDEDGDSPATKAIKDAMTGSDVSA